MSTENRDIALEAARAGAVAIRAWTERGDALQTERKGYADYVTAVDRAAEAAVVDVLRRRSSDVPVLAEEAGGERFPTMWVVDPLDGTTNFLRGFHEAVGVSVALMEGGVPVAGAVVAPFTGREWTAAAGRGAHDQTGKRLDISSAPADGVFVTGFPFRHTGRRASYLPVLEAAVERFEDIRRVGSASLDCCHAASGIWTGYFELNLAVWDIAAGALIVREAGGVATDWHGDDKALFDSGDILCGSPAWHAAMLELIRTANFPAAAASARPE